MAETGDWQPVLLLQAGGKPEQIPKPTARHHDILVQLCKPGIPQRIGEFTADFPNVFTIVGPNPALNEQRFLPSHNQFDGPDFPPNRLLLSVQFDDEMRAAASQ